MILHTEKFSRRLLKWFDQNRRDLPWRVPLGALSSHRVDPYHVFVSEAMLQQTQVTTVIPYFNRFVSEFPTLDSLANADEQRVLRLWQGLGYYSRARNLRYAARMIVSDFAGVIPSKADDLLKLPGVGRYTAGAIASIAYNLRTPILDGNVARVLCRLDRIESDPRDKPTQQRLWQLAEEILPPAGGRIGDFNSALMELGATVCTPRQPQCPLCPVRNFCKAFAAGVQDRIPQPRKAKQTPLIRRWTICISRERKSHVEWLIEQRPPKGRWAGMWQFITIEALENKKPTPALLKRALHLSTNGLQHAGTITHTLTHRRYHFDVFTAKTLDGAALKNDPTRTWIRLTDLDEYPLPLPHQKIVAMLNAPPS